MSHCVFNQTAMEFRYGSGETVYSERLLDGRLLCRDYHAAGLPQHLRDLVTENPIPSFRLIVDGCDASFGWEFVHWSEGESEKGQPFAELVLKHSLLSLVLSIRTLMGNNGFFSRRIQLRNASADVVGITSVEPLSGSLWELTEEVTDSLKDYDKTAFSIGRFKDTHWGTEGNFEWNEIHYNSEIAFGSSTGRSGHTHPFVIAHSNVLGGYFVAQMEWSANWKFRFANEFKHRAGNPHPEQRPYLRLTFALGPDAPAPMRMLDPGETVELPPIHFGYVSDVFDGAIQSLHSYQRRFLTAKPKDGYEMVVYDHWGFMEHRFSEETLIEEVERAASIGCELFIVDAGWYGTTGSHWWTTVGDWNACRLPRDLTPVIDRVHALGMRFGLWVEPESVGAESELAKKHPEWMIERYGNRQMRCLDLAKPEVEAFVEASLRDIIDRYHLDLLRLDYNNEYVLDGGFNRYGKVLENNQWRHVEAIHRIFDHIRSDYPTLLLENCAGGGGRTDMGQMTRFSKTQFTDWNRFPRIARTFNGMSMCLPPECLMVLYGAVMSAHRNGGAELQMQMMVQGIPSISGLAPNGEEVNPAHTRRLSEYIRLYKDFIRPIQKEAKVFHHTPEVLGLNGRGWMVLESASPDGLKGYAFLVHLTEDCGDTFTFYPRGLDMTQSYRVTFFSDSRALRVGGYELFANGIPIRLAEPLLSQLLLFEAE